MTEFWSLFGEVFSPLALLYAIAAGLGFGATVILYISLRFPPRNAISTPVLASVITVASVLAGTLFFAGGLTEQLLSGDPLWPRALARGALWEAFSVSIGAGLAFARSFAHRT